MSIYQKIELIRTKINDLTGMINRSVAVDELPDTSESCGKDCQNQDFTPTHQQRLGIMILKLQDDQLQQKYLSRLENWLLADPQALNFYVEFTQLTAGLQCMHSHVADSTEVLMTSQNLTV